MDIHVVRAGETVSSVAARYGLPAGILAGVNGVAPDAPLAVGQTLVVRHPRELHTVASGESVYSIALRYGLSVRTLYQNNPALGGRSALYPGQTLVIAYDDTPTRTLAVNAYSYPFIRGGLLDAALPYLTYLTPFTYGINADGTLLPLADEWLLTAAGQYRTAALMHLSTLTEEGRFDNARSTLILEDADAQDALVQSILETVQARHYFGLDVDFEYVLPEQREAYAAFITRLREALNPLGCPVIVALAPKTSAAQRGLLYEAHDYALLGAAANAVFLMTYEWGYAYAPPDGGRAAGAGARRAGLCPDRRRAGKDLHGHPALRLRLAPALRIRRDAGGISLAGAGGRARSAPRHCHSIRRGRAGPLLPLHRPRRARARCLVRGCAQHRGQAPPRGRIPFAGRGVLESYTSLSPELGGARLAL